MLTENYYFLGRWFFGLLPCHVAVIFFQLSILFHPHAVDTNLNSTNILTLIRIRIIIIMPLHDTKQLRSLTFSRAQFLYYGLTFIILRSFSLLVSSVILVNSVWLCYMLQFSSSFSEYWEKWRKKPIYVSPYRIKNKKNKMNIKLKWLRRVQSIQCNGTFQFRYLIVLLFEFVVDSKVASVVLLSGAPIVPSWQLHMCALMLSSIV